MTKREKVVGRTTSLAYFHRKYRRKEYHARHATLCPTKWRGACFNLFNKQLQAAVNTVTLALGKSWRERSHCYVRMTEREKIPVKRHSWHISIGKVVRHIIHATPHQTPLCPTEWHSRGFNMCYTHVYMDANSVSLALHNIRLWHRHCSKRSTVKYR